MIAFSISGIVGSAGLLMALAGTVQVGWTRWGVTAGFTGAARLFGPEATSQVSGTAAPADQRRWRQGWTLIFVGFALQLLGLWL